VTSVRTARNEMRKILRAYFWQLDHFLKLQERDAALVGGAVYFGGVIASGALLSCRAGSAD
jgi:hypothetical protein